MSRLEGQQGRTSAPAEVSLSSFSFLFSDLCSRAYNYPTKVRTVEEVEARLTSLGAHVGTRLVLLASLNDASLQRRPLTVEAVLKLVQERLWKMWFGCPASDVQRESNSDRFFVVDKEPLVLRYMHPSPDFIDDEGRCTVNYASFMGGVLQGALTTIGFEAEVATYHQPEAGKPHQSLFVVSFSKEVWDRERCMRV